MTNRTFIFRPRRSLGPRQAGVIWFRLNAQSGAAEIQVADACWTNPRWQRAEFRYIEPGELIVWHFQNLQPALFKRNPSPKLPG